MTGCHQPCERIVTGTEIPVAWFAYGLRIIDISRPHALKEVAYYMPDVPPGSERVQSNDVTVDDRGLIYLLDRVRGLCTSWSGSVRWHYRPSSAYDLGTAMASGVFDDALIKHLWSTDELRAIFNDATACRSGTTSKRRSRSSRPSSASFRAPRRRKSRRKRRVDNVDIEAIAAEIRRIKHPLVPALNAVQELCKPEHGEYIHFGPTTQDVLDTAHGAADQGRARDLPARHEGDRPGALPPVGNAPGDADGRAARTACRRCRSRSATRPRSGCPRWGATTSACASSSRACSSAAWWARSAPRRRTARRRTELEQRLMKRLGLGVADINWQPARDRFAEYVCVLGMHRRDARQDRQRDHCS